MIVPGMVNDRFYIRDADLGLRTDPTFLQYHVGWGVIMGGGGILWSSPSETHDGRPEEGKIQPAS